MQPPEGSSGESKGAKARDRSLEPLPPLVSAALEPGKPTLAARLERIRRYGGRRARYTLLGELAQGGMGRILRAWDEGLSREVAMKVVPREPEPSASDDERADHERRLERFVDEARITAQLDHPGIVPVYEIGLDEEDAAEAGDVFFTMPLVRGQDLKSVFGLVHRGEGGWTLQRAVGVMHTVCLTVAFAHQKGVVHRDLKPENIMVGPFGEAYVVDWGLALLLGRAERGGIVGTPAYMAPEQAAGRVNEIGPRSDVYSLGAILYELFGQRVPHELSLETRAREDDSFGSVLAAPPRRLDELRKDVPSELAAICAKAMASDPAARYASALEMADDLAAWLEGRVVSALDTSPWTRLRKWRGRNRALALALDALVAMGLAGAAAFMWQQRAWLREVQAMHREARDEAYAAGLSAADLGLRAHEAGEARRRLAACDETLRGWEWRHLELRADCSARVLLGHAGGVRSVAVSPDGRAVASGSDDGAVKLWEARRGTEIASLEGHTEAVAAVAFSPDGTRLASASRDRRVCIWDVASRVRERVIAEHETDVVALAFSHDGAVLASGDAWGGVVLSAVASGLAHAARVPETRDGIAGLAFVAGTGELAAAHVSGFVRMLDPDDLALEREAQVARTTLTGFAADPHGIFVAVAFDRTALVLDAAKLEEASVLAGHGSKVSGMAFSPDGTRLASCSFDNVVRVWELEAGRTLAEFDGHDADVNGVAFFPDGERLVTGAEDDSLRVWELARAPVKVLLERGKWIDSLAFSPDGTRLATGAHDSWLRVFELSSGRELAGVETGGIVDCVAWSARDELAWSCEESAPRIAPAGDPGTWKALAPCQGFPRALSFDPRGARLFVCDSEGLVSALDVARGARVATLDSAGYQCSSLALSRDGRTVAAGTDKGDVLAWDALSLARRATWTPGKTSVSALAFSPDGSRLAVGRLDSKIVLLSTRDGSVTRVLAGHEKLVSCLAFSPDGTRLVSGAYDHTLRVWSPENDAALLTLHGHTESITAVAFDPRGEVLASASKDGTLRLWRTARSFDLRADGLAAPAEPR
jgi:WD40 repeat protein/tRNA A-37 threonylcarbamoyl transferase component Bud32